VRSEGAGTETGQSAKAGFAVGRRGAEASRPLHAPAELSTTDRHQARPMTSFLIYGANGYTGRLIARRAVERGLRPLLAGRNGAEVGALAAELGLAHRAVALDDTSALDAMLHEVPLVLHCAGPFARTSRPMEEACLRTGAHYLDITGEIEVFERLAARGAVAAAAGVMLLPGVGFDVVPSDCLAAHLARRLPTATHLALAFQGLGGVSRGTATTAVENLGRGGAVRREGRIVAVPAAWRTREVDFGRGPRTATTIPWGDVSTAFHSTGIRNVEVYMPMSASARRALRASRHLGPVLGSVPVQRLLKALIARREPGPSDEARLRGGVRLWGEASDGAGRRVVSRLSGPEGYTLTAHAAVAAVEKVLGGEAAPGFRTPSLAFGADFVMELDGVEREDAG
jgi:short subunit dehydrogenase-like uncharacterized protein